MSELTVEVYLALGANLGDRGAALRAAVDGLAPLVRVTAVSPVYETDPAYRRDQPRFLNAAIRGSTELSPAVLLSALKDLESEIGRRETERWGPRAIDIDILTYGDLCLARPELSIPHSRLHERGFVLRPLADLDPDWRHPESGRSVGDLLGALPADEIPTNGRPLADV